MTQIPPTVETSFKISALLVPPSELRYTMNTLVHWSYGVSGRSDGEGEEFIPSLSTIAKKSEAHSNTVFGKVQKEDIICLHPDLNF